jgi:rod shape-determining protein MreD
MVKKILAFIIFFYVLALFQTSFLVHFKIFGQIPNLILLALIIINIFEKPKDYSGVFAAVIGGFFLDIFSEKSIGLSILILVALSLFIKLILKKYVQIPTIKLS